MALDEIEKEKVYNDTVEISKALASSGNAGILENRIGEIYNALIKIREKAAVITPA